MNYSYDEHCAYCKELYVIKCLLGYTVWLFMTGKKRPCIMSVEESYYGIVLWLDNKILLFKLVDYEGKSWDVEVVVVRDMQEV